MKKIYDIIDDLPELFKLEGVTREEIVEAEKELGLKFANDYKDYLLKYGVITYDGHEITGLCNHKRLDVRDITRKEREYNDFISDELYVIEQLNIDGEVIWQNKKGEIFWSSPSGNVEKINDDLIGYIKQ